MSFHKKRKRANRLKRRPARKSNYSSFGRGMPKAGGGKPAFIGSKYTCNLTYNKTMSVSATAPALLSYVFRGNSCFDPDLTAVTGFQPRGHDQMSALFERYIVYASKIRVKAVNNATDSVTLCLFCSTEPTLPGATTDIDNVAVQPQSKTLFLPPRQALSRSVSAYQKTNRQFGLPSQAVSIDADFGALTTQSPIADHSWYWHLAAQCADGATDPDVSLVVSIDYYVRYQDPIVIGQS